MKAGCWICRVTNYKRGEEIATNRSKGGKLLDTSAYTHPNIITKWKLIAITSTSRLKKIGKALKATRTKHLPNHISHYILHLLKLLLGIPGLIDKSRLNALSNVAVPSSNIDRRSKYRSRPVGLKFSHSRTPSVLTLEHPGSLPRRKF